MSLVEILSGEFFNQYIKTGNILMRSEGRQGVDDVIWLANGVLHIEVDKPTYERVGLVGKPVPSGGRKHIKARYAIDLDLRPSSMVRGKKGFERLLYAAKNTLDRSMTWLFADLTKPSPPKTKTVAAVDIKSGPIAAFHPEWFSNIPDNTRMDNVSLPFGSEIGGQVKGGPKEEAPNPFSDSTYTEELLEWLGLLAVHSPRVSRTDRTDPFLCIYDTPRPPLPANPDASDAQHMEGLSLASAECSIRHIRWRGFMSPKFVKGLFLLIKGQATGGNGGKGHGSDWFAVSANGFDGKTSVVLHLAGSSAKGGQGTGKDGDVLCWEIEG